MRGGQGVIAFGGRAPMKMATIICLVLLAAVIFAVLILARGFTAEVVRQEAMIRAAPTPEARDSEEIPELMRRFAERGLVGQGAMPRAVRLTQEARMLQGENWSTMTARQHIAIAEPGFVWVADGAGWPLPLVRVIDRFTDGAGLLEVRLLGAIRMARFDGPEADIGEAMRYLVELPWAPDAILSNRSIIWRAVDANTVEAALPLSSRPTVVQFRFDDAGDIVEVFAEGRPDVSSGQTVLRAWRGVFSDYGEIGGRRVPRAGEVGYVDDGIYAPYFRGRITSFEMLR